MSFDGIFTHLIVKELSESLVGGRINKIHQPYEQELVLIVRSKGKNQKLLLSAHPSFARVQVTNMAFNNPDTPPNFLKLTRKFLEGAFLSEIEQIENDRVIHFHFTRRDELGDLQNIVLIAEIMGRHSNIILVNKDSGKIMESIKHVGFSQNTYRTILPGSDYIAPPKQLAKNPFTAPKEYIFEKLSTANEITGKFLQANFQGLGMDTAAELATRLNAKPNEKIPTWQEFFTELNEIKPTLAQKNEKEFFTPLVFQTIPDNKQIFGNLNDLLDAYYQDKAEKDRVKQQSGALLHRLEQEVKKNQNKLIKLEETIAESENAEMYRQYGELVTAFVSSIPRGSNSVKLNNYYDENNAEIEIVLDPAISPAANAQKYFQRYQKLKAGVKIIQEQMEHTNQEIEYLQSVLSMMENATPMDLPIIQEELLAQGFIKRKTNERKKPKASQPQKFLSSDGTVILVGRNNLQNDQLTLKTAKKTDYWLHAKNIPGSHVIIQSDNPTDETITEAGVLAAYFSKYRLSNLVPVDLIQVKYIKKPNGSKPGFVVYEGQKTIHVTPDKDIIEKLQRTNEP
ncbi:MAG: NFACT family protein [Streptococcaceae bacterium]|jgi:predicted ribosome quality control (RQC) complex YloA/Tae2 family protein|nr:NFACT family protein [Streptococcaceae bacterium]